MGILVGIDEAGYGPHLGPLVVAAAALEFDGDALPEPDLWHALREHVHPRPSGAGGRVVICDSKVAYGGGGDVAPLERTVLALLAAMGRRPRRLSDLAAETRVDPASPDDEPAEPEPPWDAPQSVPLPADTAPDEVEAAAGHLAAGLTVLGGRPAGLWINVAPAARLNRLMDATRNKARALFALAADLLATVLDRWPREPVHITMDSHGGRRYYAGLLAGAFPMMAVEALEESATVSRYRLRRGGGGNGTGTPAPVLVTVRNRCETWSLATALASMAAKYVRELHMRQMNAYFRSLVPGLRPTAGYGLDAWRFLGEVAAAREAGGIADALILRSR